MAFTVKGGAVFVHVPRTGGTFVTKVLRELHVAGEPIGLKHDCPGVVPFDMGVSHFVFVRHPYELMKSTYGWLIAKRWGPWPKEKEGRWWHPWSEITKGCDEVKGSFSRWLQWVLEERTGYVTRLYSKFAGWPCSVVGKTESLEHDLVNMLGMVGVSTGSALVAIGRSRSASNARPVEVKDVDFVLRKEFVDSEAGAVKMWEEAGVW